MKDYMPIGLFVFEPAMAFVNGPCGQGERPVSLEEILAAFPGDRIVSASPNGFTEYDRNDQSWHVVGYAEIIPT